MAVTEYYAVTREKTARGDVAMSGTTWKRGSPMLEVARNTLGTKKGMYIPDRTFGVDLDAVQKGTPNAAATFRESIIDAFRRYTRRGLITDLRVVVETVGDRLQYDVSFIDPLGRDSGRQQLRGFF
jgi:hypothetical protein